MTKVEQIDRLTLAERETIINFDEAGPEAYIFTYNNRWQRVLEQKLKLKPIMDNGFGGREYKIDKKRISPPRAPVKMSQEQRIKAGRRLKEHREKKAKGGSE